MFIGRRWPGATGGGGRGRAGPARVNERALLYSQMDGGLSERGASFPSGAGGEPPQWSAAGQAGPLFCTLCGTLEEDL